MRQAAAWSSITKLAILLCGEDNIPVRRHVHAYRCFVIQCAALCENQKKNLGMNGADRLCAYGLHLKGVSESSMVALYVYLV